MNDEGGREWNNYRETWKPEQKDRFTSVATAMVSRLPMAGSLSWGARVEKVEVEEIFLGCTDDSSTEIWGRSIEKQRQRATVVFTDRSRGEEGGVGGGWYWKIEQEEEVSGSQLVGPIATV